MRAWARCGGGSTSSAARCTGPPAGSSSSGRSGTCTTVSGSFRPWSCYTSWSRWKASAARSPHHRVIFVAVFDVLDVFSCSFCTESLTPPVVAHTLPHAHPNYSQETDRMTATLEPTATTGAKATAAPSAADVIRRAKDAGVQIVDVKFTDLPGTWQVGEFDVHDL